MTKQRPHQATTPRKRAPRERAGRRSPEPASGPSDPAPGPRPGPKLPAPKRWLFRTLASALSLILCFACLEIALRIWGPDYYQPANVSSQYYSNPRGYFDLLRIDGSQPVYGIRVVGAGNPLQRVPEGLTSREAVEAFLARDALILGLGDSFTVGRSVRWEDIYLRRLEKRLAQNGMEIPINNVARAGYDLPDIVDVYETLRQRRRYPVVLYGFVLNDFGLPGREQIVGSDYIDVNNSRLRDSPWRRHMATARFLGHLLDTIRLDRATKKAYLAAFEGEWGRRGFQLLAALNRRVTGDGGTLVIVLFPLLYDLNDYPFQTIHDRMAHFCRQHAIPLLDLVPTFARYRAEDLWVHPLDHHPNEIAHRIAADAIYQFLKTQGLLANLRPLATDSSP